MICMYKLNMMYLNTGMNKLVIVRFETHIKHNTATTSWLQLVLINLKNNDDDVFIVMIMQ